MGKFIYENLAVPRAAYIQATDPADDPAVLPTLTARVQWIDISVAPYVWKKRNDAANGWDVLGVLRTDAQFNEAVQDVVGAMFPDTATVDFTYNDATGVVTGVVIGAAPSGAAGGDLSGTYPNPTVNAAAIIAQIKLLQKWSINFTANGDAYIPAYEAMTVDAGVAAIGTGTLAYQKSTAAAPSTFSATSLPATLEANAWLKVSVSGLSVFKAVELKRTA